MLWLRYGLGLSAINEDQGPGPLIPPGRAVSSSAHKHHQYAHDTTLDLSLPQHTAHTDNSHRLGTCKDHGIPHSLSSSQHTHVTLSAFGPLQQTNKACAVLAKNGASRAGHSKQAPSTAALDASICLHSSGRKHMLAQGTCQMQVILALQHAFPFCPLRDKATK